MATDAGRYRFPPLERRGIIAGISGTQLAVAAGGCATALAVLRLVPGAAGTVLALTVVTATGVAACWRIAGRTPGGWAPIAASWLRRRAAQPGLSDAPEVGTTLAGPPRAAPPVALAGVRITAAPEFPGSPPMGVVRDIKAGTLAAMLAVRGRSFSLLDPSEKHRRLEAWGAVLAGLCREGSPVHRIQWVERAMPGDRDGLRRYLEESGRPALASGGVEAWNSYAELISGAGPVGETHTSVVVLAIHRRKAARAARTFGRGQAAACGVLRRELRLLEGQLRHAELVVDRVLTASEVVAALRAAVDPPGPAAAPAAGGDESVAWPMATDEGWATWRSDSCWHASYWISEWPRMEVGADFLSPLLLAASGCRTASVVMAPIPAGRAAREVEAARTADLADEQLRQKAGFLTTARRQREAEGVIRRESELADGHAEFRFSGYVTVSAANVADLDLACVEIEQAARQSNLELRRLYGQQAEAFTWTLPLARGLK
ncbi:MAG: type VII secretion protein EccE [Actinomycetota bacterium]|nr:type VII secretion protein EccE [Actinomycetota bacterium]MDQ6948146.1 type VII secretion protein EccE [Actinomycetota bacterium]